MNYDTGFARRTQNGFTTVSGCNWNRAKYRKVSCWGIWNILTNVLNKAKSIKKGLGNWVSGLRSPKDLLKTLPMLLEFNQI